MNELKYNEWNLILSIKNSPMSRAARRAFWSTDCPCGMHKGHLGGGETLKRDRKNHGIWKRLENTGKLMEIVENDVK